MIALQRCDSPGNFSSDEEGEWPYIIEDTNNLMRHKCQARHSVYYFKGVNDSKSWGVYTDTYDVTRCKFCEKMWPIQVKDEQSK